MAPVAFESWQCCIFLYLPLEYNDKHTAMSAPLKTFIIYSSADRDLRTALERHSDR